MEEMRIVASRDDDGELSFESYDAEGLFLRGVDLMNQGRCGEAISAYDRVADEFPASRWVSPALYNAGLCARDQGDLAAAAARFERLFEMRPDSPDVRDARFVVTAIYIELERWEDALGMADLLLRDEDLEVAERIEAMSRRAQALLGLGRLDDARKEGESTVAYFRGQPEEERPRDDYFISAAAFVWAETLRLEAEEIRLPNASASEQHDALERRAQAILDAQQAYNRAIRFGNPHWAAASGYRIGAMYDAFWTVITSSPVPEPESEMSSEERTAFRQEYRTTLARVVKPLIRHAIRFWESTLLMVERTGVQSEWALQARQDLELARSRLLDQPEGPEGLRALEPSPPDQGSSGAPGASEGTGSTPPGSSLTPSSERRR
jgi:tetratricopeptide (TPR) repeat protein